MKGVSDLKGLTSDEANNKMTELKLEIMKLKGQASTGTAPQNPSQIKKLRRTIARLKTLNKK